MSRTIPGAGRRDFKPLVMRLLGLALVGLAGCASRTITVRTSPQVDVGAMPRLLLLPFSYAGTVKDPAVADRLAKALADCLRQEGGYEVIEVPDSPAGEAEAAGARAAYFAPLLAAKAALKAGAAAALTGDVADQAITYETDAEAHGAALRVGVRLVDAARGEVVLSREERVSRYAAAGPAARTGEVPRAPSVGAAAAEAEAEIVRRLRTSFLPVRSTLPLPAEPLAVAEDFVNGAPVGQRRAFAVSATHVPLVLSLPEAYDRVPVAIEVVKDGRALQRILTLWDGKQRFACFRLRIKELAVQGGPGTFVARCRISGREVGKVKFELLPFGPKGRGLEFEEFDVDRLERR